MSNGEVRKVSVQDIQLVQNLVERCLQLYMSQREVVSTLLQQAKIEPSFTELVWQKLEAENQDFFRAYHLRLIVKDQILRFNQLLQKQIELMEQISQVRVVPMPPANGSHLHSTVHESPAYYTPQSAGRSINQENLHWAMTGTPSVCATDTLALQPHIQVGVNPVAGHGGRFDVPENVLLTQGLNARMTQDMNGRTVKAEDGYAGNPAMFGADNNLVQHHCAIGEVSISPFNGGESNSQAVNDTFLDMEANSFGFLGQIPRNFSLSDLSADFTNSTDILASYSRSPFLVTDANFVDPQIRGEQQDLKRLDTISEGFGYEDFSSD